MVLIPLGGLFLYHFRLVLNNQTTIEMVSSLLLLSLDPKIETD